LDIFSFNYRDPIYGVILLVAIVVIVSFFSYSWGFFKTKEEESSVNKFLKKFHQYDGFTEYKEIIQKKQLPIESSVLMALTFEKGGEYQKAIEIYQAILEGAQDKVVRKDILTLLGKTYYKAGFLERSREILLTALKIYPKNEDALTYLIVIYDNLREYDKALDVLDTLEAFGIEVEEKKLYFKTLQILHDKSLSEEKKLQKLKEIGIENKIVQRKLFEFLKMHNLPLEYETLNNFDFDNIIDLIWETRADRIDERLIEEYPLLAEIYTAKGEMKLATQSPHFELNILIKLALSEDKSADISFDYTCSNCKNTFPLYFYRCPQCQHIGSAIITTKLTKREYEKDSLV
jgi:lipopolysaccharide biosynthesis regulator YciM